MEEQGGHTNLSTVATTHTESRWSIAQSRRTQEYTLYLIATQLAIEVVGGSDGRNHVGSLHEDRSEIGEVNAIIDSEIEFMIKAMKIMDSDQSRCFRHVSAMIMSQSSSIKTPKKKKDESKRKQAKQKQDRSYAKVIRAQYLLDPLNQIFAGVAVSAKEDVQGRETNTITTKWPMTNNRIRSTPEKKINLVSLARFCSRFSAARAFF